MPGKLEIMRAVREGLDGLKVVQGARDTEWTSAVETELCRIGQCQFRCKVGARTDEVDEAHRDYGEWLFDVTWLEYGRDGRLIDAHLVAECESRRTPVSSTRFPESDRAGRRKEPHRVVPDKPASTPRARSPFPGT